MNPLFFGPSDGRLYGAYFAPSGRPRSRGVVICNPFGDEAIKAHRALRQLALMLVEAGLHVFRFDYLGTGDSAGDDEAGTLAQWVDDTVRAIDELRDTAGLNRIAVTGLRLGASIAYLAARHHKAVDRAVLWDPVLDGSAYLTELKRHHQTYLEAEFKAEGPRLEHAGFTDQELMGVFLSTALHDEIEQLRLATVEPPPHRTLWLVHG
ncbi:MAG: alpha/beta hydrolase, partial [Myxococcota bacterium]